MRRLWLIFAQATTVCLAVLFVISTLKPEWLSRAVPIVKEVVMVQEDQTAGVLSVSTTATAAPVPGAPVSYAEAVKKAMPAVVNLYSAKENRTRHPMLSDPLLRRFFGQQMDT